MAYLTCRLATNVTGGSAEWEIRRLSHTITANLRVPFSAHMSGQRAELALVQRSSRVLKQIPCRQWLEQATNPDAAISYGGIGAFEAGRTVAIEHGWVPWQVEFPMCRPPHLSRDGMLEWARSLGLRPPALYEPPYSLPHNNFYWTTRCRGLSNLGGWFVWIWPSYR